MKNTVKVSYSMDEILDLITADLTNKNLLQGAVTYNISLNLKSI